MSPLPWGSRVAFSSWTNPCDVILPLSFIGESACLPPRELMVPWREAGRKLCVPISEIKHEARSQFLNTCLRPFVTNASVPNIYMDYTYKRRNNAGAGNLNTLKLSQLQNGHILLITVSRIWQTWTITFKLRHISETVTCEVWLLWSCDGPSAFE